jgi:hypothetical protein
MQPADMWPLMEVAVDDTQSVRVVTTGHVVGGFDRAKCISDLAKLTRQDVLAERLLDGAPHVVKRNIDAGTANAYVRRLRAIGVECAAQPEFLDLELQPVRAEQSAAVTPRAAVAPGRDVPAYARGKPAAPEKKANPILRFLGVVFGLFAGFIVLLLVVGSLSQPGPSPSTDSGTKTTSPKATPKGPPSVAETDLLMLRATAQQLASIENDFSDSQIKFRELLTYGLLHAKGLSKSEEQQYNSEFRQVFTAMQTTLGRSNRVLPISLRNAEASQHLANAVTAHKQWSAAQSERLSAFFAGDFETAMRLAKDESAATSEVASLLAAYKALGVEPERWLADIRR